MLLKIIFRSGFLLLVCLNSIQAQEIINIDYKTEGKEIVIEYELVNCKSLEKFDITVKFIEFSTGDILIPRNLSGDLFNVNCGKKKIVWQLFKDIESISGKWLVEIDIKLAIKNLIDISGNEYRIINIGGYDWMADNLNVSKFRNGDEIPQAKSSNEWEIASKKKKPVWCYYNNDSINGMKYGKLYNWYAINDPRGLAPKGWRIPTNEDWNKIINFCGGEDIAGIKLQSKSGWAENGNGNNETGFNGLPGGYCDNNGNFSEYTLNGYWWSLSDSLENATIFYINYLSKNLFNLNISKGNGVSVRCIKN